MKPFLLIILDGWGERAAREHNAVRLADAPHFQQWWHDYPHTTLLTHGPAVGLTEGVMGNSEVGHMNLGAGRIVRQTLTQISQAIEDGSFFLNPALLAAMQTAKHNKTALHLMGLLSDAGVHSDQSHLEALLRMAKRQGLQRVYVHAFMDGRDTQPISGQRYLDRLLKFMEQEQLGTLASLSGRYYAMDRDKRWDRTQRAYDALVLGEGHTTQDPRATLQTWYADLKAQPGAGDEFLPPTVCVNAAGQALGLIHDQDVVIHFNFRPDRARQLTQALTDASFQGFIRKTLPRLSNYTCMASYGEAFNLPVAFSKENLTHILPEIIAEQGIKQFRVAETEKYAHVTYFFNGGEEQVFPGEERQLIPSNRDVATYDLAPEMRAPEVTAAVLNALAKQQFGFFVINFANPDMVGHTGNEAAAIKAVEILDKCLAQIVTAALAQGGSLLITADHGNCEEMLDADGLPHTQHTLNPVPCLLIGEQAKQWTLLPGRLCDVAPTILQYLGIQQPKEMTAHSLLRGK